MTTSAADVPPGVGDPDDTDDTDDTGPHGGRPPGRHRGAAALGVVEALAGVALPSRFRDLAAEATGVLRWSAAPSAASPRSPLVAVLDSDAAAARLVALLDRLGVDDGVVHAEPARGRWRVELGERHGREVARRVGLVDAAGRTTTRLPSWLVGGSLPEAVAAWRGALLAAGHLDVPDTPAVPAGEQGAAVTLPCPSVGVARDTSALGLRLGLRARPVAASGPTLRVDGPGDAALLLASCGGAVTLTAAGLAPAPTTSGGEAANATRAAVAASRTTTTVADAFAVLEAAGVDVPAPLADAGRLRLRHPSRALVDLAALADPPTTKDALAGRLRRLAALAARHRPGTRR